MSQRRVLEPEVVSAARGMPETEPDRDAVREQLERILANPLFTHSKRYPLLLRWVVERALEGRASQLKERTLGVEVFGRDPDYDTNTDPVVRITAGEIRKRIAQYYHEPGRENEIRIDLPTGCYVPEFHKPATLEPPVALEARPNPQFAPAPAAAAEPARTPKLLKHWYWWALAVLPMTGLGFWLLSATPSERFWRPFWDSSTPTLLCIGGAGVARDGPAGQPPAPISVIDQIHREYVAFSDATTLSRISGVFQARNRPYSMRIGPLTTFADLRNAPVVLVGGFNNWWTMRLLDQLRFSMTRDRETRVQWISDRVHPEKRDWVVNPNTPNLQLSDDYAIVSRVLDPTTERMVVVAAGLLQYGTIAAGEFLSDPRHINALSKVAPRNWEHMNMQVVIGTKVVNGNSGPPQILATHFW